MWVGDGSSVFVSAITEAVTVRISNEYMFVPSANWRHARRLCWSWPEPLSLRRSISTHRGSDHAVDYHCCETSISQHISHVFFQAGVRKRSRAADILAAAHVDYARAVARCQPSGDNISAGPPSDVVLSGDKVVEASDAFAEAHGLAEEALSGLLEGRGRCLREAMSSVR